MRQFISVLLLCCLVATALAQTNTAAPTIEEVEAQIKQVEQARSAAQAQQAAAAARQAQANRASEAARQAELAKQEAIKRDANAAAARMATLLFRSDAECSLSINGEAQGVLAAGATKAVKVNPGDQIVDCVSVEYAEVVINTVKTAAAGTQSAVVLALADKIESERKKAAQAAQKLAAASRFEDIGDGSIKDSQTGLVWAQADNGSDINWNDATRYCADQSARLPTVEELQGIFDKTGVLSTSCGPYTCKVSPLFQLTNFWFWSSEQNAASEAWGVYLGDGARGSSAVGDSYDGRALCVRRS